MGFYISYKTLYRALALLEPSVLPPKSSAFPTSFQIVLHSEAETPDTPCSLHVNTHPVHDHIDLYLTAFQRLAPLLMLAGGEITVVAHVTRNEVAFSPRVPSGPLSGFLSQIAMVGASDLAEVRRQVEGYPYEKIAELYEQLTRKAKRTRRVMPMVTIDTSLMLASVVTDVLGGPAIAIRLSPQRDAIRLCGLPFNQPFAGLANDAIMRNARAAIKARLPILGRPKPSTRS